MSTSTIAATAEATAVLRLRDVHAGYGGADVLRGADLTVAPGSVTALLGPNGAGKTTLLRTVAGLLRPRQGTIRVGEHDVTRLKPHRRARHGVCLIPEGRGVFRSLTVRENLRLQVPSWGDPASWELPLEAFPALKQRLGQRAGTMSGGQQQMLALSRCFLSEPSIVLLDEVSMGLAPRIVDEIFVALSDLASRGVALLLVEQYVHRALEMADAVHLINRGELSFSGRPSELDEDALTRDYLGSDIATT